jgi:protoheme IX farnesyltransferase
MVMGLAVNWIAAGLLAGANLFYVLVYTMWLKRRTPQNIVIGGAAGAFPPMIGWASVTGDVGLVSLSLFALIFLWTPPHFWALSLYTDADYSRAGVPMLPVVAGRAATKRQMLVYTLLLLPLAPAPWLLGAAGPLYGAVATAAGLLFVIAALRVLADADPRQPAARRMFGFSILYLFLIFAMLIADGAARAIA